MSNWLDHSSIVGKIGGIGDKVLNPISWITKGKSTKLTSEILPEKVNSGLSNVMKPFDKVDKTINPVRRIPIVNRIGDIVAAKPGDAGALAVGSFFGGGALVGAGGAGGAGSGGLGLTAGVEGTGGYAGEVGLTGADVGTGAAAGDGLGGAAAAGDGAITTSSGFGGVGTDPGVTASPDGGAAYNADQASAATRQQSMQQDSQQKKRAPVQIGLVASPSDQQYAAIANSASNAIAQSSKNVKTRGATGAAMERGLRGAHPVDTNGVHIAAIQELNKQIDSLSARIAAAKARRAKGA